MPGDIARARGGYYANLLSSGAKPFLYRSGVFRLLGLVAEPQSFNGALRFHTEFNYLQPREPAGTAAATADPSPGASPALPEPSPQSRDGRLDHGAPSTPARRGGGREEGKPPRSQREDLEDVALPGGQRAVPATQSSVTILRANASAPALDGSGRAVGPSRVSEPDSDRRRSDGPSSGSAVLAEIRTPRAVAPQVRRSSDTKVTAARERPPHEAVETRTGSPADAAAVLPRPHDIVDMRGIRRAAGEGGGSRVPVEQSRRNSPFRAPSLDAPVPADDRPRRRHDDAAATAAHRTAIDSVDRVRTASRLPAGRRGRDTAAGDQAIEPPAQDERPRDPVAAPPRRITVVNAAGSAPPRLPRAFWASSVLRSMHLRRLR